MGGIELYAGPPGLGGPDDLDAVIREFIDGARTSFVHQNEGLADGATAAWGSPQIRGALTDLEPGEGCAALEVDEHEVERLGRVRGDQPEHQRAQQLRFGGAGL